MGRSILLGLVSGSLLGGVALSVLSLSMDIGSAPAVPVAAPAPAPAPAPEPSPPAVEEPTVAALETPAVPEPSQPVIAEETPSEPATAPEPSTPQEVAEAPAVETVEVEPEAPAPAIAEEAELVAQVEEPSPTPAVPAPTVTPEPRAPEPISPEPSTPEAVEVAEPATPAAPAVAPEVVVKETAPTPQEPQAPVEETVAEPVTPSQPEAPVPLPTATAGGFGDRAESVTVNRPAATGDTAAERAPRAIDLYSQRDAWSPGLGQPLFSIVMIDEAGDASLLGALGSFQGPLTFAIPATSPTAAEAMATYRAAGYEVVIIADLPEGATPADTEVAMQSYLAAIPEAMAVLDGTLSGFRGDRDLATQVSDILAETGHGLLTFDQGLSTAAQLARRAGVPTGAIFRDLDAKGQGNTVIRRFLDQAAFTAGQQGELIVLARMRPETMSALLIWHQQDRAARLSLVPLSQVLLTDP
ncbi:MAG: divergent polysaccharide deacetylase family protein [Pseudomonadota bacterium]